ncbi:dipeptide/oligopeptide/nickel ABC transporter ATP-binding protein [Cellulomonas sp. P24]|uniref:ATP-binding cassette domain-containing protein n=1 Tax=Cellulomonas sp. P24 TaxID=2885206 RepID=UPI00216ACD44|nr:dipeptide/oligopeptide/nickel ABC transporter ATP-binding protein [Cellulomonas sp. P24]MCR6492212.1 dipeptide/oligopeptide/nickel ABC transporter ATP-binding protein [Cellulomonas sp. P24]
MSDDAVLRMTQVRKSYRVGPVGKKTTLFAVKDIDLIVRRNVVMGLVGESGSGKSTLGRLAIGLIPPTAGRIECAGEDIVALRGERLRRHRLRMQMIFQDSGSSLNPRLTLRELLEEPLVVQRQGTRAERARRVLRVADEVGLSERWLARLPHEFSGGQRQRISIARALVLEPEFIAADEPVSALDVSVQAQVLNIMKDVQEDRGLTMLFISHDLGVVNFMSDEVTVLHHGEVVERGCAAEIMSSPQDPYTQTLVAAARIAGPDPDGPES